MQSLSRSTDEQESGCSSAPILVTGMPRSGTTWLARLFATAPGTALAGREPMNPRGRQYALAGTLDGWTRLTRPTPGQVRALRLAYRGRNPFVYSRYGRRQWRGLLPSTRVIVKDPFAMLSLPAIGAVTGAAPVLVYRHPGAIVTSYRRMGWRPDVPELLPLVASTPQAAERVDGWSDLPDFDTPGSIESMAWFWTSLHELLLADLLRGTLPADLPQRPHGKGSATITVVPHRMVAAGGDPVLRALFERLDLEVTTEAAGQVSTGLEGPDAADPRKLHNFDRPSGAVAEGWRKHISVDELRRLEELCAPTMAALDALVPASLRAVDPLESEQVTPDASS